MITFVKKTESQSAPGKGEENRFDQIRKAAKEAQRKSDTEGTRRPTRRKAEDDRLI